MLGVLGVTAMEVSVGATVATVMVADPLNLVSVAVTVVDPEATPLAIPLVLTVAIEESFAVQVADVVTLAVDPSL